MNDKITLKDCPFCGSDKISLCQWADTENPNTTWIECTNCGISQDSFHHEDAEDVKGIAIMMWNTRVVESVCSCCDERNYKN